MGRLQYVKRHIKDGIRFKAIEGAARLIQYFSPGKNGLLIRRHARTDDAVLGRYGNPISCGIIFQGPLTDQKKISDLIKYAQDIITSKVANHIVISTWENEFTKTLPTIKGIKYVVSEDTNFKNNLQRQIYTTHVGIESMPSSIDIIMKMRVDQRLSKSGIVALMKYANFRDYEEKIIFTSMNSYIYRIFGLSDMLNVGKTANMKLFWQFSGDLSIFDSAENKIRLNMRSWVNSTQVLWNESFLNVSYAYKKGFKFSQNAWKDYLNYLREYCVVIDSDFVGQTWLKIDSPFEALTARSIYNHEIADENIELTQTLWDAISKDVYHPPFKEFHD